MANKIFNFPVSEMKIFEIDHGSHWIWMWSNFDSNKS
jgi:hypothetical protein